MTAEQRMLVLCRGVLLVDELAFPAAIRGGVGAEIIKERVAAENAAVFQQHHAGLSAGDAVQHPDVDRVKPADDAAFTDRSRRRNVVIAERGHDRAEHRAGVFHDRAREVPDVALRLAAYADRDGVGADQHPPMRRRAVAPGPSLAMISPSTLFVGAEVREAVLPPSIVPAWAYSTLRPVPPLMSYSTLYNPSTARLGSVPLPA